MSAFTTSRISTVRLSPPRLPGGNQRLDQFPFFVGQIAWIAQTAAIITPAILYRPHPLLPQIRQRPLNHKQLIRIQLLAGQTMRVSWPNEFWEVVGPGGARAPVIPDDVPVPWWKLPKQQWPILTPWE